MPSRSEPPPFLAAPPTPSRRSPSADAPPGPVDPAARDAGRRVAPTPAPERPVAPAPARLRETAPSRRRARNRTRRSPSRSSGSRDAEAETWTDEIAARASPPRRTRSSSSAPTADSRSLRRASCSCARAPSSGTAARCASPRSRPFRGTRLEKILRADGRGYLFVNDPGRQAFRRDLAGRVALARGQPAARAGPRSLVPSRADPRLPDEPARGHPADPGARQRDPVGDGAASRARGLGRVSAERLVARSRGVDGDLVPSVLEDRFLEEVMMPDSASAPEDPLRGRGDGPDRAARARAAGLDRPRHRRRRRPPPNLIGAASRLAAPDGSRSGPPRRPRGATRPRPGRAAPCSASSCSQ